MALDLTPTAPAGREATPSKSRDVVAVLNAETFEQVFAGARPLAAQIYEIAEPMEHPVEDGTTIVDHVITKPVEIDLPLVAAGADYADVFAQIRQLFRDRTLLTVQTRAASYENMLIIEIPREETGEVFDGFNMALRLKEVRIVRAEYGGKTIPATAAKKPANASTVKRGQQQPVTPAPAQAAPTARGSALYSIFKGK